MAGVDIKVQSMQQRKRKKTKTWRRKSPLSNSNSHKLEGFHPASLVTKCRIAADHNIRTIPPQ